MADGDSSGQVAQIPRPPAPSYIREKRFSFDEGILRLPDNVYIKGNWQSEKYFRDIESLIRRDFVIGVPPSDKSGKLARTIASVNSVSVHFRRGDYASDPKINAIHGVLDLAYYHRSFDLISKKVQNPHLFAFSDDPAWVAENVRTSLPLTLVASVTDGLVHEDLRLMSLCKHHIVANSSFSWWGAWLSPNPDKIVMAPKRWFNSPDFDTRDLLPENWVQVWQPNRSFGGTC